MSILLPPPVNNDPTIGNDGGTIIPPPNIDPGTLPTGDLPTFPNPNTPSTGSTSEVIEATRISQMYSFSPAVKPHFDTHKIGVNLTPIASASYRFRNNTVSTSLRFDFTLPTGSTTFSFLKMDPLPAPPSVPDGLVPIIPPPGASWPARLYLSASEERVITFAFNEEGANDDILKGAQIINAVLMWNPVPLNVTGPVYVYKNLPTLDDPNKTPEPELPPIQIEGPGYKPPEIKPVTPVDPPTHLYLSLSPANPRVPFIGGFITNTTIPTGGTQTVELVAWAGDEFVAPNVIHAIKLNFAPGSLIWAPQSSTALTIDPLDGSSAAIFKSRSILRMLYGKKTTFTVHIAKPPLNMSAKLWDDLYRSNIGVLGDSNAIRVPLPNGTLAYKLTGIATS